MPHVRDLPSVLPVMGYGVALLLGVPSLLLGTWKILRRDARSGGPILLLFFGPLLVLVGTELVPHLLSPCAFAQFGVMEPPGICERTPDGIDIKDRWHALDHAVVGAVPMVALYWTALRRWRPEVSRYGKSV